LLKSSLATFLSFIAFTMYVALAFATLLALVSAVTSNELTSSLATRSAVTCPAANNTIYTASNGATFAIECVSYCYLNMTQVWLSVLTSPRASTTRQEI